MTRKKVAAKVRHRKPARFATAEFDQEMVIESFAAPPAGAKTRWARAAAKPGRPPRGAGAKVVSISVERGLLQRADWTAKRLGITRSELVARGLRAALAATGSA